MAAPTIIEDGQTKVDDLNKEAWEIRVSDSSRAFSLSREAVVLAQKIGYNKGLAEGLRTFGFSHIRIAKLREAKELLDQSMQLFSALNDEKGQSDIYEYYGIIDRSTGHFDNSLKNLYYSLDLRLKTGYREGASLSYYHLGATYKYLGNFEKALDYLLQSLAAAREINYWVAESYALNLVGQIYFETADFHQALHYYQQSLAIRKKSGDQWGEAGCLDNIGYTFFRLGNVEEAILHCTESLTICRKTGDKKGQANTLFHLSELLFQKGEEKNAIECAQQSLQMRRETGDKKGQAEQLLFLAGIAGSQSPVSKEKLLLLTEALDIGNEIKAQDLLANIHFHFYKYHKQSGDHKKALASLETFNQLEKELHKDALAEKVINLQISHRAEQAKKEAENYRLRNDELAALYEELKKQKEETEQQKQVAEASLQQLKATQAQLVQREKMASLGELTAGIAHEIQNPLNFVNNFSEVNLELLDEVFQLLENGKIGEAVSCLTGIKSNEEKITFHGRRADAIVKAMLQHSRTGGGEKEPVNLNALVDEYLRLSYHGFRARDNSFQVKMVTDFDTSVTPVFVAPQEIGRVLLNLYNNAFYAVKEKQKLGDEKFEPLVSVSTAKSAHQLVITVRDNGTGIPQHVLDKIFQPFFTTRPTGEGTGLGLSLCYDIITNGHGGELKVETEEGKGASFMILLPLPTNAP